MQLRDFASRPRLVAFDAARGVAILAMAVYHIAWDLYYLGFISTNVIDEPGWLLFQRAIVAAFLLLVGVSLVLGHGLAMRWRSFWRRFAVLAGAAVLTTIGTYLVFPDYVVFFGILHAIALFSLMGLAFLRAPLWLTGAAGIAVLILPALVQSEAMREKWVSWLGFWPYPPMTTDIVPVFPWFGVVLLGIAGTRLLMRTDAWEWLTEARLGSPLGRTLAFMGRWSLVIYLVHQPVIFGSLSLIANWTRPL